MDENIHLPPPYYTAYLLRLWSESSANPQSGFRLMLIDLRTGEQWGFANLERLFNFLGQKVLPDDCGTDDA